MSSMNPKPMKKQMKPEIPNMELPERVSTSEQLKTLDAGVRSSNQETGIRTGAPEQVSSPKKIEQQKGAFGKWIDEYIYSSDSPVMGTFGKWITAKPVEGVVNAVTFNKVPTLGKIARWATVATGVGLLGYWLYNQFLGVAATRAGAAVDTAMQIQDAGRVLAQPEAFTYPGLSPASGGAGVPAMTPAPIPQNTGPILGIPN